MQQNRKSSFQRTLASVFRGLSSLNAERAKDAIPAGRTSALLLQSIGTSRLNVSASELIQAFDGEGNEEQASDRISDSLYFKRKRMQGGRGAERATQILMEE